MRKKLTFPVHIIPETSPLMHPSPPLHFTHSLNNTKNPADHQPRMSAIGFCHTCDIQTQIAPTEPPTCLKCRSDFVEVFDLAPEADRPEEPAAKQPCLDTAILDVTDEPSGDADITCPICFDEWTSGGEHRLVSLKCGHLFGESCIARWLQTSGKCAQCNQANRLCDIRRLFAKSIKAADTVSWAGRVLQFSLTDLFVLFVGRVGKGEAAAGAG